MDHEIVVMREANSVRNELEVLDLCELQLALVSGGIADVIGV